MRFLYVCQVILLARQDYVVNGHYYYIKTLGSDDAGINICYFAICKYDNDSTIYLFSCDENMNVEGNSTFENIDDAIKCAEDWSESSIKWTKVQ